MATSPPTERDAAGRNQQFSRFVRIIVPACVLIAAVMAFLANLSAVAGFVGNLIGQHSTTSTPIPTPTSTLAPTFTPTSSVSILPPYAETAGGDAHTWTNYMNAGGTEGPTIAKSQTVQMACKRMGFKVADGNPWWYRIASSPWNGQYYVSADAFYNNGQTSGSLTGTPWIDPAVPDC